MPTTEKYLLAGSATTVLSTELNNLANNALVASSVGGTSGVFDNTAGATLDGYTLADVELVVTFGVAPAAATGIALWFLGTVDSSNYEDGSASVTPARPPDLVMPLRAVTTAQRVTRRTWIPWGTWYVLAKNDGTGQQMAASSNTVKIRPVAFQGV